MSDTTEESATSRSAALLGERAMVRLAAARVTVVGVGGVGSWCAEALVRTGVGHVTLVDDDRVVASNLNRQCPATVASLGQPKVEAMRDRLRAIAPTAEIAAVAARYAGGEIPGGPADAVVDAIDSTDCKAELILTALASGVPLVSSMGAARRMDPTQVRVSRFEKVEGDGLAKALRQRFKRLGRFPSAKFACVWSTERPQPGSEGVSPNQTIKRSNNRTMPKGSLMTVTATFGMCLAAEVIKVLADGEAVDTVLPRPPRQEMTSNRSGRKISKGGIKE